MTSKLARLQILHIRMHQDDRLHRNFRLIEEGQGLAGIGAVFGGHTPRMGGDIFVLLKRLRRHRQNLAEVQLSGVRFRGKAFALLSEDLPAEPLELVLQIRDGLSL